MTELRTPWLAKRPIFDVMIRTKGFAILLGWFCGFVFCVRKFDDVIPDYVIVILRFLKNGLIEGMAREKGMNLDRSKMLF